MICRAQVLRKLAGSIPVAMAAPAPGQDTAVCPDVMQPVCAGGAAGMGSPGHHCLGESEGYIVVEAEKCGPGTKASQTLATAPAPIDGIDALGGTRFPRRFGIPGGYLAGDGCEH